MTNKPKNTGISRNEKGQFVKGQSGNPEGKKEGSFSLVAILKKEIQKCPKGQDKKSYAVLVVTKMLNEAIEKGDVQMIKLIWAYIEGMPKQSLEVAGKHGGAISLLLRSIYDKKEPLAEYGLTS